MQAGRSGNYAKKHNNPYQNITFHDNLRDIGVL
jgi:hypothetical protein